MTQALRTSPASDRAESGRRAWGWGMMLALLLLPAAARAQFGGPPEPSALKQVALEQKMGSQISLDLPFRDESGASVKLGEYFHANRPVMLVLAYYECPMLCTLVLNALAKSTGDMALEPGRDFEVVVVSINPRETPALAAKKKANYANEFKQAGIEKGWHFLTGQEPAIATLADAVGYRYAYDANSGQYAHPAGAIVLTPQGLAARYFFGTEFVPRDMRLALVEASQNHIGSVVDQVLLRCYQYDPMTGKYGFAIKTALRVGAILTVAALGVLIVWALRRERRQRHTQEAPA